MYGQTNNIWFFLKKLFTVYIEKARSILKKNSIQNYIHNINILHDRQPYDDLDWLTDVSIKVIRQKLETKKYVDEDGPFSNSRIDCLFVVVVGGY